MKGRLRDKVAIVTGAAQGIGRGIAEAMLEQGATVVLTDIQGDMLYDGGTHPSAILVRHDVTSEEDWNRVAGIVEEKFGRLDVLVNNAGIVITGPMEETSHADWRRLMTINVDSAFLGCKALLPMLKAGGSHHPGGASVINLSSVLGMVGVADEMAYSVSKAAVRQMARTLAIEWAQHGYNIRANSIHPGIIRTRMLEQYVEGLIEAGADRDTAWQPLSDLAPLRRVGSIADIGAAAVYLASEDAGFVNATELVVDGGLVAR